MLTILQGMSAAGRGDTATLRQSGVILFVVLERVGNAPLNGLDCAMFHNISQYLVMMSHGKL